MLKFNEIMVNDLIIEKNNLNLSSIYVNDKNQQLIQPTTEQLDHIKNNPNYHFHNHSHLDKQQEYFNDQHQNHQQQRQKHPQRPQTLPSTTRNPTNNNNNNVGNLSWTFFDQISLLDYQLRDNDEDSGKININDDDAGSNSREVLLSKSNPQQSAKSASKPIIINTKRDPKTNKLSPSSCTIMSSSGSPSGSTGESTSIKPNYNHKSNHNNNNNNNNNNTNKSHNKKKLSTIVQPPQANVINSITNLRNDTMISNSSHVGGSGVGNPIGSNSDINKTGITIGDGGDRMLITQNRQAKLNNNYPINSTNTPNKQQHCPGGTGGGSEPINCNNMPQYGLGGFHLGLFGWRKKCLYTLILVLMLLIIVNLVLTLWILKVMEFSSEGMGQLKIVPGGIQLSGQALIMDLLRASTIRSKHGQPITLESSRNFSINTRDSQGILENHLFLGHDKLECLATGFRINDTSGRNLFSVNRDEVTIGAHSLRIDGDGGAIFRESIQTPHVRADAGRELRLESPTRQLEMSAAKDITIQSRAGGLDMTALDDVKLSAIDGSIRIESSKIFLPNLKTAQLLSSGTVQNNRDHTHRVYQLCACSNGKLFLAPPHSICAGDDSSVCR